MLSYRGTPVYMAPEIIKRNISYDGMKADIFSLGVVMFTIVFGCFPFTEATS